MRNHAALLGSVWILWQASAIVGGPFEVRWSLLLAHALPTECEVAGLTAVQRMRTQYPLVNQQLTQQTVAFSQASVGSPLIRHSYHCLPDTIDPRAPKREEPRMLPAPPKR
jgi:hypothetical protein